MELDFDFNQITDTEFGIGRQNRDGKTFLIVRVDVRVQEILRQTALATSQAMQQIAETPLRYEASESYGGKTHLYVELSDSLSIMIDELHNSDFAPTVGDPLANLSGIFCYVAKFTDNQNRRLTALKRATQFKSLDRRNVLARLMNDALTVVESPLFKLDEDFDLLATSQYVHVLHPRGFEFMCDLQEALRAAAPRNLEAIRQELWFVNLEGFSELVTRQVRAARHLSSIRAGGLHQNIDRDKLAAHCAMIGISLEEVDGRLVVPEQRILDFLEMLDRRRFRVDLVEDDPEHYRAPSRARVNV